MTTQHTKRRSKRAAQHLAIGAALAAGFSTLVVIPAAADSGASPTPGPAELAAAAKALADANTPWVALDQTTDKVFNPIPTPWAVAAQPTQPAKATQPATQGAEVTGQRRAPVIAPQRTPRPSATAPRRTPRVAGARHRTTTPRPAARPVVHRVQDGETLTGIGRRYGVAPLRIASHNRVSDPDFILAGARLVIPGRVTR